MYDEGKKVYGEYNKHKWPVFWKFLGIIVFLIVCSGILKVVFFPVRIAGTALEQAGRVIEKTLDADNVIYTYEWFKKVYNDVQATGKKINNSELEFKEFKLSAGERKDWSFEDKNEYSRLSSTLTGLRNHKESLISEYNAKSSMINRSIFKGTDLPTNL